jgi:hypothetical protein
MCRVFSTAFGHRDEVSKIFFTVLFTDKIENEIKIFASKLITDVAISFFGPSYLFRSAH